MGILKNLKKRIGTFFSILISTANLLSILITILAFLGLGSATFGYATKALPLLIVGIIVLIIAILLFAVAYTFALEIKKVSSSVNVPSLSTPAYPDPQSEQEVELLLKEVVYQYLSGGQNLRQRKRFKIRALRDGVGSFTDRYRWTGNGQCDIKSLTVGFSIVNQRKVEFWDYLDVSFPHPLRKNEEVDFTVEWELFDATQTAVPFLSTMIDFNTKYLLLRVILPPEMAPKGAYCYEFSNYIESLPVATQATQWDSATQSINYEVPNPKRFGKYMIRWYS